MNPRESFLDDIMDEFASEQSTPVDFLSFQDTAMNIFNMFTSPSSSTSSSSTVETNNTPKIESITALRISQLTARPPPGITSEILAQLPTVADDSPQLKALIRNMRRIFREYQSVNASYRHSNSASVSSVITRSQTALRRDDLILCFSQVPAIFFNHDFSLRDSDIFQVQTTKAKSDQQKCNMHVSTVVQDRLSIYLDTVETSLFKQIWTRSPDFFRALDDLSGLRVVVAEACKTLAVMRSKFRRMDKDVALTAMRIPLLNVRYKNELRLFKTCQFLKRIKSNFNVVQSLQRIGDYVGALQLANETIRICDKELKGIKSIQTIKHRLRDVEKSIGERLVKKFIDLALDWNVPLSILDVFDPSSSGSKTRNGGLTNSTQHGSTSSASNEEETEAGERDPMNHVMTALLSAGLLDMAINEYKNRLCDNVRLVVRTCVTEYMSSFDPLTWSATLGDKLYDESNSHDDTPFAQRVRSMNSEDFLSALSMCIENLLSSLQRTASVHTAIMNIANAQLVSKRSSLIDPVNDSKSSNNIVIVGDDTDLSGVDDDDADATNNVLSALSLELSRECVVAACDLAQRSISQLLKIRRDNTSRLALEKMKFLSETCRHFLVSLDKIYHQQGIEVSSSHIGGSLDSLAGSDSSVKENNGQGSGPGLAYELSKTLRVQSRAYIDHLQDAHKQRLVSTLDSDRWVQADVSPERHMDIDRLVSGRAFMMPSSTSAAWFSGSPSRLSNSTTASTVDSADKRRDVKSVNVDGIQYRVVWSCLLLIEQLVGYLDISSALVCVSPESIAKETIPKIVELLKLFDTRTKLLVLGAGAIQSAARLKSISAKHLAITIQSLGLVRCLIPHIRAALLATLNVKYHMLLSELDRVANDYIDHHSAIVSKLVTIAGDSVENSATKLKSVDWDRYQGSGNGSSVSNDYFEDIIRNISALHRVLYDSLSLELLQDIFNRIFALLARRIPSHFDDYNINPGTDSAKQRIVEEVMKMTTALGKLKGVESPSAMNLIIDAFFKKYTNGASRSTTLK